MYRTLTDVAPARETVAEHADVASSYLADLARQALTVDATAVAEVAHEVLGAIVAGRSVFVAGNGGSAAAATHTVCDWTNACVASGLLGARIIGLSDNTSTITAAANDYGYTEVFARQLELMGAPDDVLVLFSVSGDSRNLVRAAETARSRRMRVVGLFGHAGATVPLCDVWTEFGAGDFGLTEDLHLAINHIVVRIIHNGQPRRCPGAQP